TAVSEADVLLLESTYGDRLHERDDDGERLGGIVGEVAVRGGRLIIPSFAVGRVEEVLYWLKRLEDSHRIPVLPVYLDSPMAIAALQFYIDRMPALDMETPPAAEAPLIAQSHRSAERAVCDFCTARMITVATMQQSKELA